jgi:DNA-binding CsgD family transcriptional regulator
MGPVGRLWGRAEELRLVAESIATGVPLVLVVGDAGIGKTSLVQQALEEARAGGGVAVLGGCLSLAESLPLLPFAEALRGLDAPSVVRGMSGVPASLRPALSPLVPAAEAGPATGVEGKERGGWEQERLFFAVAAFLRPLAATSPVVVAVEDLHWADPMTLDLLTYLVAGTSTGVTLMASIRSDETPLPDAVAAAVGELRRSVSTVIVELAPLSRAAVVDQVTGLLGRSPPPAFVDELVARGGGNPFFTEQLVSHALATQPAGAGLKASALPSRLAGFLGTRIRRASEPGRVVLAALGVAARPLSSAQLTSVTGLDAEAVDRAVRELSRAALLVRGERRGLIAPRHALLAAAVIEQTDPVTLAAAHERVAQLLEESGDPNLSVEIAGHWAAAGREREELRASLAAAGVAESLAAYATAASLWVRVCDLARAHPAEIRRQGHTEVGLAVRAIEALTWSGQEDQALDLAESTCRRLAPVEETLEVGRLLRWLGYYRAIRDRTAADAVWREAVRILSLLPATAELSGALRGLGNSLRLQGRHAEAQALLERAISVARTAGAPNEESIAAFMLADVLLNQGHEEKASTLMESLADRPGMAHDARAQATLAIWRSGTLIEAGRLVEARAVAAAALELATNEGYGGAREAAVLRYQVGDAELELGRTSAVYALIESVASASPVPGTSTFLEHTLRARADLNRGLTGEAVQRVAQVRNVVEPMTDTEDIRITAEHTVRILLWAGQLERAVDVALSALDRLSGSNNLPDCGELFTLGAAAAADLAAQARARHDEEGERRGEEALRRLEELLDTSGGAPFAERPGHARVTGDRLQWRAELFRAAGDSDPDLWAATAQEWERQSRRHRAAYAWWRHAQAQVDRGDAPAQVAQALQRAHELAEEMVPLRRAVRDLAARAHVRLTAKPPPVPTASEPGELPVHLTAREREILAHIVAGRSNAQIAEDLFITDKTVSTHISNLLGKLGVRNRIQAAAWAERVGIGAEA